MLWFHGVSVGESLANLTLVKALREHYPELPFLLTSTTATSKKLIEKQLDANMTYEKFPLDFPWDVNAFLKKHNPSYAIFAESELWPFMLGAMRKRNIPASLINARLSSRSYKRWSKLPFLIKPMLSSFDTIFAQSEEEAQRYKSLTGSNNNAPRVLNAGNIKFAAKPLEADDADLVKLRAEVGTRPCLLYASTHSPEEILAARIHKVLRDHLPDLLTIIVPRHPERGSKLASEIDLPLARRSQNTPIQPNTQIYLADTLGELGLFFRLCNIVIMGNSFTTTPGGGHNPIEPAHLDCAILYGPEMFNFKQINKEMIEAHAARQVSDEGDLAQAALTLLQNTQAQSSLSQAAKAYARSKQDVLPNILEKLRPLIDTALAERN